MKKKVIFGAALTTILFGVAIAGSTQFTSGMVSTSALSNSSEEVSKSTREYDESSFNDSVEITRDDLLVDIQSVTTTPASKSATISFNTNRLVGWPSEGKAAYVIIDDADYSGSPSSPSLSGKEQPVFDGYTVEMDYVASFTLDCEITATSEKIKRKEILIPERVVYGDAFAIANKKIYRDAFVFTDADVQTHDAIPEEKKEDRLEYIVIPDGIESIQAGAFQNVPSFIKFKCELTKEAAIGYEAGWCDADESQIEWGYHIIGADEVKKSRTDEARHLDQSTGTGEKYYGKLDHVAVDSTGTLYFAVDDPNWTGDFDNPSKTGSAPYELDGYVCKIDDSTANKNIIIPEKVTYNNLTINVVNIPADVLEFKYQKVNQFTAKSNLSTMVATVDGPTFDAKLPKASKNTYFTFDGTSWKLSSEVVNLADYGITITSGTPENGTTITIEKKTVEEYTGSIESITIPSGIERVENGAFKKVPSTVSINCEASSKPASWGETWTSKSEINWNTVVADADKTIAAANVNYEYRLDNEAETYILGYKYTRQDYYYCQTEDKTYLPSELHDGKCPHGHTVQLIEDKTPEHQLPLVVSYDVLDASTHAKIKTVYHEMPLLSEEPTSKTYSYFDSVKSSIFSRSLDILLEDGQELDATSFGVHNIFKAKFTQIEAQTVQDGEVVTKMMSYVEPDTRVNFSSKVEKRFEHEIGINEVIKYRYKELAHFSDHFVASMEIDKVLPSYWYTGVGPSIVSEYQDFIDSGEYSIRYAIYDLQGSFYRVTYYSPKAGANVTVTIDIDTPNGVVVLENNVGNQVSFIIDYNKLSHVVGGKKVNDFKIENLRQVEILGLTINIHLWNNAANTKVGRTDLSIHFGAVDVLPLRTSAPESFSLTTFTLIFAGIYTAVYAVAAVALFFYLRNKFKNDEFRRMKPKQYVKGSILGYLGSIIVSLTVLFVIFRATVFSNSVAAHNPLDVYIVIPGVISIIVIGYFIKFMVARAKTNKQRKEIKKLKLNEDTKDDGTN